MKNLILLAIVTLSTLVHAEEQSSAVKAATMGAAATTVAGGVYTGVKLNVRSMQYHPQRIFSYTVHQAPKVLNDKEIAQLVRIFKSGDQVFGRSFNQIVKDEAIEKVPRKAEIFNRTAIDFEKFNKILATQGISEKDLHKRLTDFLKAEFRNGKVVHDITRMDKSILVNRRIFKSNALTGAAVTGVALVSTIKLLNYEPNKSQERLNNSDRETNPIERSLNLEEAAYYSKVKRQ
jgi:hypothetical protein